MPGGNVNENRLTEAQQAALDAVVAECSKRDIEIWHIEDMTIDGSTTAGVLFSFATGDRVAVGYISPSGQFNLNVGNVTWTDRIAGEV